MLMAVIRVIQRQGRDSIRRGIKFMGNVRDYLMDWIRIIIFSIQAGMLILNNYKLKSILINSLAEINLVHILHLSTNAQLINT